MENKWKFYETLDLDEDFNRIDTRDFHGYTKSIVNETYTRFYDIVKKYRTDNPDSCYTLDELKQTLDTLFTQSGGAGKWRMLAFNKNKQTYDWRCKYINIYRLKSNCFVITTNLDEELITKSMVKDGVNQEHLSHH